MDGDLNNMVRKIICNTIYLTLATASRAGDPWSSPLYFAYDNEYNIFWSSSPAAQHSLNIADNDKVFITIFDSSAREGTGKGVYIQARASEMSDLKEIARALIPFYKRKGKEVKKATDFVGQSPRRMFKAVPEKACINTYVIVDGYGVDRRVAIDLAE